MSIYSRDASCLTAIIESIALGLREEPVVEGRIVDLLTLVPELLRAHLSERRIVYLISTCQPLATVVRLLHPSLHSYSINFTAVHVLLETLTWCADLPEFATVEPVLTAHLKEASALHTVIDALLGDENEALQSCLAELLFVLVARFVSLGELLIEIPGAIGRISAHVCRDSPITIFTEYMAGVLRVCGGLDPARLPSTLPHDGLVFLAARCGEQSHVVILLAECVGAMVKRLPQLYLDKVKAGDIPSLSSIITALKKMEEKQRLSLVGLLDALLQVEGDALVIDPDTQTAAYKAILNDKMLWTSQEELTHGMDLVLSAVNSACTEAVQVHVASAFVRSFPTFCHIIMDGTEKAMRRAALVVGLVFAKNPQARATVLDLTRNYIEWSKILIHNLIDGISHADPTGLVFFDVTGAVLNDPETLPAEECTDIGSWAESVLTLQEQRVPYKWKHRGSKDAVVRVKVASKGNNFLLLCSRAILVKACEKSFVAFSAPLNVEENGYERWLTQNSVSILRQMSPKPKVSAKRGGGVAKKLPAVSVVPRSDAALGMALLCHIPMMFGSYFKCAHRRSSQRRLKGPDGCVTQTIHRNAQNSWGIEDVLDGELYSLFVPFVELTAERMGREVLKVESLAQNLSRKLVTTPTSKRHRRWFLMDMVNNILPRTEVLLRDLANMLQRHGPETVLHQLGVIRLLDARSLDDGATVLGVPHEITILSETVFRDVLHSGNLVYCTMQLRNRLGENV